MAKSICSLPDCGRAYFRKARCYRHYYELPGLPQCSIAGCARAQFRRELCDTHFRRQSRGLAMTTPIKSPLSPDRNGLRVCARCSEWRPLTEFYRDRKGRSGRKSTCVECHRSEQVARYRSSREVVIIRVRAWQRSNPEAYRKTQAAKALRRREASSGLRYGEGFSVADLIADGQVTCAYCDRPVAQTDSCDPLRATLDHVVPLSRGGRHERANAVVACSECNTRKWARTPAEWMANGGHEYLASVRPARYVKRS